ncbi:hypothetical protein ACPPVO_32135 [Dactylosporangium sp. McL0621]
MNYAPPPRNPGERMAAAMPRLMAATEGGIFLLVPALRLTRAARVSAA